MFCGPRYGGGLHYGRIDKAVRVAKRRNAPLLICGDGDGGEEISAFLAYAAARGTEAHGAYDRRQNTRGDARAAVRFIASARTPIRRVILVTDWYHMPRARIALKQKLKRGMAGQRPRVRAARVWQLRWVTPAVVWNNFRCVFDYLLRKPHTPRGKPFFKRSTAARHRKKAA